MGLLLITPPTGEVITLTEAKQHLRVGNNEDDLISSKVAQAGLVVENELQRQLLTATWDLTIDQWDDPIRIPRPPLQSVTYIKYLDPNGVLQTLATSVYEVVTTQDPGLVRLKNDQTWPSHLTHPDAITIRFVAGYGAATAVPGAIKAATLIVLTDLYENREWLNIGNIVNRLPAYERLIDYYRVGYLP